MDTLDLTDYRNRMKRIKKATNSLLLKQYVQANVTFLAFGVVVYTASWLLQ